MYIQKIDWLMGQYKEEIEDQKYHLKFYKAMITCIDLMDDRDSVSITLAKKLACIMWCKQLETNKHRGTKFDREKITIKHTNKPKAEVVVYLTNNKGATIELLQTKNETLDRLNIRATNASDTIERREANAKQVEEVTRKHLEYKDREMSIDYKLKLLFS